jgi:hypothetical protein
MLPSVGLVMAGLDPAVRACAQEERSSFLKKKNQKTSAPETTLASPPRAH